MQHTANLCSVVGWSLYPLWTLLQRCPCYAHREVSRLGYYVKQPNGQTVTPFDVNLFYPNGGRLVEYISANDLSLTSQLGAAYTIQVRESVTVDHTTLSSNELRRAKEAFKLYVDGDVSPLSFSAIAAVLQEQVRGECRLTCRRFEIPANVENSSIPNVHAAGKQLTIALRNIK